MSSPSALHTLAPHIATRINVGTVWAVSSLETAANRSAVPMAPIARSTLLARALRARAGTVRQSFTRLPRRSYASGHGPVKPTLQSEMPW